MSGVVDIEVQKQFSWTTTERVLALAQYQEHSLVYGSGSKVCLRTLDAELLKFNTTYSELTLRSPVVNLTVDNDVIYVSTRNHSVVAVTYQDSHLIYFEGDPVARSMMHHLSYGRNFVIGCDKDNTVIGLHRHEEQRHRLNMSLKFRQTMPSTVSRLRLGRFVPVRHHPDIEDSAAGADVRDVKFEKTIVGTAINGSVYGFRVLSKDEFESLDLHFRRVVFDVCRLLCYNHSDKTVGYPLKLYLIPKKYGVLAVLNDLTKDKTQRRLTNELNWRYRMVRESVGDVSVNSIDGDVLAYLNDVMEGLKDQLGDSEKVDEFSMGDLGSMEDSRLHNFYEFTQPLTSRASHLQPQEWINRIVNGMEL
ncbi:hypothetical protein V1512DRAFT_212497 [Lipomyces arxii]|uniref:uncharacterized protein n=1 Tax=Lipomyces arxii TaxID=56418 RepID=UPI0034CEDF10